MAEKFKMPHDGRIQRPYELAALVNSIQNQYEDGEVPSELQYAIRAAGSLLKDAMMCNSQATTQGSGDFFALPAELRNRIYELCIDSGKVVEIHWTERKGFSALTQVNQQMRYETISYYQSYQDIRIHSCMEHRHRLRFFLDGPGRMIVPYMKNFELHFRDSELTIMLPDKTAKLEIIHVFMSGGRGSTETQQQEDARLEKLDAVEADIRDLLDVKVTCRADGGYWISCDVLKEVHKMCSDFDDRAFGCACGQTTF